MLLAYIPSPPGSDVKIGPLQLHVYGALIVAGVVAAVWLADRRWRARGGEQGTFASIAMWAVPGGLVGARLYHVATDYELYTHHPLAALEIWNGGLGIWGGVAGGVLAAFVYVRRHGLDFPAIADCAAPALPLAQAIGRWGNYFNQELFGRPSTLPWALKVDVAHRPNAYVGFATFQPTFLYESLWDLAVVGLVLLIEKRVRIRTGYLFLVYVTLYTFGRFFTEYLRIDFAHKILGLRLNDWTSVVIFGVSLVLLLRRGILRGKPEAQLGLVGDPSAVAARDPVPTPAPVAVAAGQAGSTLSTTDLQEEFRPPTEPPTEDEPNEELPPPVAPAPEPPDEPEVVETSEADEPIETAELLAWLEPALEADVEAGGTAEPAAGDPGALGGPSDPSDPSHPEGNREGAS